MKLDVSDIEFLANGSWGLRYVTRPQEVEAHKKGTVTGDAYSLSGLQELLKPAEKSQFHQVRKREIEANKHVLPERLTAALTTIISNSIHQSVGGHGQDVTFMLIKEMQGADLPYDMGPGYPTGKAGRKDIHSHQVVAYISLSEYDILDSNLSHELGQGKTAIGKMVEKVVEGIQIQRVLANAMEAKPAAKAKAPAPLKNG